MLRGTQGGMLMVTKYCASVCEIAVLDMDS